VFGDTRLHMAIETMDLPMARLLLSHGADASISNTLYGSAHDMAASKLEKAINSDESLKIKNATELVKALNTYKPSGAEQDDTLSVLPTQDISSDTNPRRGTTRSDIRMPGPQ